MYVSSRSTRSINAVSVFEIAVISSALFASVSACARRSVTFAGPCPVSSHRPFTPIARHNAAKNSALGLCPDIYRRTVSWFVFVISPSRRNVICPATAANRPCSPDSVLAVWLMSPAYKKPTAPVRP